MVEGGIETLYPHARAVVVVYYLYGPFLRVHRVVKHNVYGSWFQTVVNRARCTVYRGYGAVFYYHYLYFFRIVGVELCE